MLSRCGTRYRRLERAEHETARALPFHLNRIIPPQARHQDTLHSSALTPGPLYGDGFPSAPESASLSHQKAITG